MCPGVTLLEQPPVAAWPVLSVLGAMPEQAARVAECWSMPSSVEPSGSQRKPLVDVTNHLVTKQGWGAGAQTELGEDPRSHPVACGFRAGGEG